jgi:hypothetical protein
MKGLKSTFVHYEAGANLEEKKMLDIEDDGKKLKGGVFVASHERRRGKNDGNLCTSIAGGVLTYGWGHSLTLTAGAKGRCFKGVLQQKT